MAAPKAVDDLDNLLERLVARLVALEERTGVLERQEASPVVARYKTNAGQNIPDTTMTIIDFEDVDYDTYDAVTTGAAWAFTAPIGGWYRVTVAITFASSTTWREDEIAQVELWKEGIVFSVLSRTWGQDSSGGSQFKFTRGSDTIYLAVGEAINIRASQISGGALALHTDSRYNHVAIERVG